jgi:hypothetical protein
MFRSPVTASTDSPQSDIDNAAPRRRPPAWLIVVGGALVVIVAMSLLSGGDDAPARPRDLSTPVGAAEAFSAAAAANDVDGLLAVTCLGYDGCASAHGGGITTEQINAAKKVLADNVHLIGRRFTNAQFSAARAGTQPGTREVDYRVPGMPEGERNYLIFVEYENRWLYISTGGPAGMTPAN